MIGEKKFNKPLTDDVEYSSAAQWCNDNGAMIVDQGDYYEVVPVPPPSLAEILSASIAQRDALLSSTDWYVIRASEPDGKPVPDEVLAYRQALRELDQHSGWPENINWPVLPE